MTYHELTQRLYFLGNNKAEREMDLAVAAFLLSLTPEQLSEIQTALRVIYPSLARQADP